MASKAKPAQFFTLRTAIAAAVSIMVAGACASERTDEPVEPSAKQVEEERAAIPEPATPPADTTQDDTSYDPSELSSTGVEIDTRLASLCGLEEGAVFFKFDSANLRPEARERLQKLATCATSGPAQGKELLIVGRTDPVGTDEYNEKLGMSRAESVASQLRQLGVEKTRIETESKGEAAASEDRPGTWPLDRRVTLKLQE